MDQARFDDGSWLEREVLRIAETVKLNWDDTGILLGAAATLKKRRELLTALLIEGLGDVSEHKDG